MNMLIASISIQKDLIQIVVECLKLRMRNTIQSTIEKQSKNNINGAYHLCFDSVMGISINQLI